MRCARPSFWVCDTRRQPKKVRRPCSLLPHHGGEMKNDAVGGGALGTMQNAGRIRYDIGHHGPALPEMISA